MSFILTFACLVVFLVLLFSLMSLMNITPESFNDDVLDLMYPQESIVSRAKKAQHNRKDGIVQRFLRTMSQAMAYMGQSHMFPIICFAAVLLSVAGIILAVLVDNYFLILPLCIGFCSLPFIVVRLYSYSYANHIRKELEVTLSSVTASYIRTNDILRAVEENIPYINKPVRRVFEDFVNQIKYVNPNVSQAVDDMREKIDDDIFKEWCDGLKKCVVNAEMKYLLQPIVEKYSTLRAIMNDIAIQLSGAKVQFVAIVAIVFANYPIVYLLNEEWFQVLINTTQGDFCLGFIMTLAVVLSIVLIYISKPIKYKV